MIVFPETLVIYHAGTGRVLYLAVLKLTTIVLSAIFCGVLVPAYISDGRPWLECAGRESPPAPPISYTRTYTHLLDQLN